jgi:16S rRNA (uracil1498-N3)-methyltransferase
LANQHYINATPGEDKKAVGSTPRHRLYVTAPLHAGAQVALSPDQSHRLLHVLRAERGDAVGLFNGRDGEWRADVDRVNKREAVLAVGEQLRAQQADLDLWLLFAPVKRGPVDLIAEKATELGVSALVPVWTQHTDVQRLNGERLASIAIEASEQCRRMTVPDVREPRPLNDVLREWPQDRRLIVLDESGRGRPIAEAVVQIGAAPAALLIGPEGGFADSELDELRTLSFAVAADLGPRILRAETAAIAALACYQALRGGVSGAFPSMGS